MLAIEHARDNPDFYGRRYARRDLVREVISQEESEDYYDIRLSYRPARDFQGEPGIEQFTIDKSGPIRLRQILSEPVEPRGKLGLPLVTAGWPWLRWPPLWGSCLPQAWWEADRRLPQVLSTLPWRRRHKSDWCLPRVRSPWMWRRARCLLPNNWSINR